MGITSDRLREEQAAYLRGYGASVVHAPCLTTLASRTPEELRHATLGLIRSPPDAFVANTATGMAHWLAAAERWGLADDLKQALASTRVYARGPKAGAALGAAGLSVSPTPGAERLKETLDMVLAEAWRGMSVGLQLDGSGSAAELSYLRAAGIQVRVIASYQWALPVDRRPALRLAEGVIAGRVHAITFTARPAVQGWFTIATEEGVHEPLRQVLARGAVTIGCVGGVCAEAVLNEGVDRAALVVPPVPQLGALIDAVRERLSSRVARTAGALDHSGFVVTGTMATIEGESFSLTPAEARLLEALVRQPNTVVTQEELLRTVWDGAARDPHVVEVVVARLRRRLGTHGEAITSIHRRGYALRI